ncbi:MAG: polyprenyl synthetase family protein [Anaerolineaceae bacterium]|nr:polyprenyl synthetase family protein [Anaerolineaceae bacterium]
MTQFAFFEERLAYYREITLNNLHTVLPIREPKRYFYELLPDYPQRGGKGLRAALCLATCLAYGGRIQNALNTAVAIELFHNGFLVHDDIQDESMFRRGTHTLHAQHGVGVAINIGNALNLLSLQVLMKNQATLGGRLAWQLFSESSEMLRQTLEGQALELAWIRDNACDLSDRDYLRMALKKTAWYTCIYPCRAGGLAATGGGIDADRFYRFGWFLGVAFQIQDDLLNLVGDYGRYGKEIYGDLWEGKRTLMLIHLLNQCTSQEKAALQTILAQSRDERTEDQVAWMVDRMTHYGSINFGRQCARQFAGAALYEFRNAYGHLPDSDDKRFILEMVLYMIERKC